MSSAFTDSVHLEWFQIAVEDPTSLSGQGFVDLLRIVTQHVAATIVAVCEVEGAGVASLKPKDNLPSLFPFDDFLEKAIAVQQFDWGDFYLCASEAQAKMLLVGESYHSSVPKASAVVRAVDDTYFYIYTTSETLSEAIRNAYANVSVRHGRIMALDFPR